MLREDISWIWGRCYNGANDLNRGEKKWIRTGDSGRSGCFKGNWLK